ncbi:hypothetical protein EW026_g8086 [Hermanssonia centrifuga]|uniref:Uncharacterized protein n=1 Tax=Hermanssonia centrifuga TaxID=98765 RepID=A0A4S4K7B9_9APHY|nr:hypothetical protein EW026_g8086 [Hermanssonia centrifuga]
MVFCRGCFSSYTRTGYISHLTQAKNPACLPLDGINAAAPDGDDHMRTDDLDSDLVAPLEPETRNIFHGDFFGTDYQDDDFDWLEEGGEGHGLEVGSEPAGSDSSDDDLEEVEEVLHTTGFDGRRHMPAGEGMHAPVDPADEDAVDVPVPLQIHEYDSPSRLRLEHALHQTIHKQHFPLTSTPVEAAGSRLVSVPLPGAAIALPDGTAASGYGLYEAKLHDVDDDPGKEYAPFASRLDWEVARWAKLRGPGSTALSDLLSIDGVHKKLGLSYKNSRELNRIIDGLPVQRPQFKHEEIVVAGESYDVHFRDIIECVQALYGDPEFARHLVFLPERHYADADHTKRLYHDMHTGKWWWAVQKSIEKVTPGATIMPIIISSDKTQVTLFGNKAAYPVYVTIGNLPKDIRRSRELMAW